MASISVLRFAKISDRIDDVLFAVVCTVCFTRSHSVVLSSCKLCAASLHNCLAKWHKCSFAITFPLSTLDRKSTRLNSSHVAISYAVFCLKKKKKNNTQYKLE